MHFAPLNAFLCACVEQNEKLENETLKEGRSAEKSYFNTQNVTFVRFEPLSKFYFPACPTLDMTHHPKK